MMNSPVIARRAFLCLCVSLCLVFGCTKPQESSESDQTAPTKSDVSTQSVVTTKAKTDTPAKTARVSTAAADDVNAAIKLLDSLGGSASYTVVPDGVLTEIAIPDASSLSPENITLFGKLTDLESLQILNYRALNDEMTAELAGLKNLKSLTLTNSTISDATVEMIVKSFPKLTSLDLSYNTIMSNGAMKIICQLSDLERLTLIQNRFNDLGTSHLSKLEKLRLLDLRGNMEAGDMTMEVAGTLPKLVALKHRSTTVTDYGLESLAESKTLDSLLMQDFGITDMAGEYIAKLPKLTQLEIFRCQGMGSQGVLALKGMKLTRLTLRDLPMVDDMGMEVFTELPQLKRLYLHELESVTDEGLKNLASLKSLELLDIWFVAQMTDATLDVIATLPNLKELSIRTTSVTDAAVDKLLAMPNLKSLTFKDNGEVSDEALQKLARKEWQKLDIGAAK